MDSDLIQATSDMAEIGVLDRFERYDAAAGLGHEDGDNDWQLNILTAEWEKHPVHVGEYLYFPNTEWGGPVEGVKHVTQEGLIYLSGVTWRGMLGRKVIEPPAGQAYRVLPPMDANEALRQLVLPYFDGLFSVPDATSGLIVSGQFRFTNLLGGIQQLFERANVRLDVRFRGGLVWIQGLPVIDHSQEIDYSQDYDAYITSESNRTYGYNHVIALGRGELTEREVVHIWRLDDGTITTKPNTSGIPSGVNLRTSVYDYSSAETSDDLLAGAIQRLIELSPVESLQIDLIETDEEMELGDIVGAQDRVTGLSIRQQVSQKIFTVSETGVTTLQHKVG